LPIIRKITYVGAARGISLPKSWLDWIRREYGVELKEVLIEINRELRVIPVLPKEAHQNG